MEGCFMFQWGEGGHQFWWGGGGGLKKVVRWGHPPALMPPMGNPVHFSDYILMTFLMMWSMILLIIYVDDTTLYSKCDRASDI